MFYRPEEGHGLPRNPFNALVLPRPIGWVSTVDASGCVNLAPYSFFNAVAYTPPQVMFSGTGNHAFGGLKDSIKNAIETGEFVVNMATWALREAMNASAVSAPPTVDEFEYAGLHKVPSERVKPPRVAESPAHLECVVTQSVVLEAEGDEPNTAVFGRVVGVHIDDRFLRDGFVDTRAMQPLGRLGYLDYVAVTETFSMDRPNWK